MRNATDLGQFGSPEELDAAAARQTGEFSKGLRRGGYGALSSLNTLAGASAQALGANDFATGRLTAADEAAAEAAAPALAPRVASLRDIHGVGDLGSYLAGKTGEMVPAGAAIIGATALAPEGVIPAALASAAALSPLEVGGVLERQRAAGQPMSLRTALPAGIGSAALQSAVPGLARAARVPGGALATFPEQALMQAGAEGLRQQGVTPGAAPDWHGVGEAAAEGAVLAAPFAGMHALSSNGQAIGRGVTKAGELAEAGAAKVGEKLGAAKDTATEAAGKAAGAAQDAAGAVGEKLAGYEIPANLTNAWNAARDTSKRWAQRVAGGEETMAEPADIVGDGTRTDEQILKAADEDAGSRMQQVGKWAQELAEKAKGKLPPEWQQAIDEWKANPGDKAAQAKVAAAKIWSDNWDTVRQHIGDFANKLDAWAAKKREASEANSAAQADAHIDDIFSKLSAATGKSPDDLTNAARAQYVNDRYDDGVSMADAKREFADALGRRKSGDIKQSADTSGIDNAIREHVMPVLQDARPDLFERGYGTQQNADLNRLAGALRQYVQQAAEGRQPSSDVLFDLMAVTGDRTTDVLEAVHKAVGDTDPKATANVFRALNGVADVQKSMDTLTQTMRKSLVPELGDKISDYELQQEAAGLMKWADFVPKSKNDPEWIFNDNKVRKALDIRYGENTDKVLAAVEKARPEDQNRLDALRVKADEEGNPIGEESHGLRDFTMEGADARFDLHPNQNGFMYDHPESPNASFGKFGAPIEQRMAKLKEAHGDRMTMLTTADLGEDHPLVKRTRDHFVKVGMGLGIDGEKFADEMMPHMAVPGTERAGELRDNEFKSMLLDTKRYGKSPSRIDTGEGGSVLDAMRVTHQILGKWAEEREPYSEGDRNRVMRATHAFMTGIAMAQERLGKTFDIPDSTVIAKFGPKGKTVDLTWGKAKDYFARTPEDVAYDRNSKELESLRKQYAEARKVGDREEMKAIERAASKILDKREWQKAKEQSDRPNTRNDETGFEGDVGVGLPLGKPRMREIEAELEKLDTSTAKGRAREAELLQEFGRLAVDRNRTAKSSGGLPGGTGQREVDPFGQIHQASGFKEGREPEDLYTSGGEELVAAPSLLGPNRGIPQEGGRGIPQEGGRGIPQAPPEDLLALARTTAREFKNPNVSSDTLEITPYGKWAGYSLRQVRHGQWEILNPHGEVAWDVGREEPPSPKVVAAKQAAFVEKARSGDKGLIGEISRSDDPKALQRAVLHLVKLKDDSPGIRATTDALNKRIGELVGRDEDTRYRMLTKNYSAGPTDPDANVTAGFRKNIEDLARETLGPSIDVAWERDLSKMPHAGESERVAVPKGNLPYTDIIRLSTHAMNPQSTFFHESLHTFFRHLTDLKQGHIMDVLNRAAESAPVLNQLKQIMKDRGFSDAALKQLNDPEERAAYMYQFWADGSLRHLGDQSKTVLGKIGDFIRSVLGIWSNDERALHIMRYLHDGEYGKDIGKRDLDEILQRKLMDVHRNAVIETAKRMTEPFRNMGEALGVAGAQRLRDTGIPALRMVADMMKAHGTAEAGREGFIPAAGAAHRRMANALWNELHDKSPEQIRAAVESLQTKSNAPIDNLTDPAAKGAARLAKAVIRAHLDKAFDYMRDNGVRVNDLGYGKDYFPRVYDTDYISRHQQDFKDVLDRHGVRDPEKVLKTIMAGEGTDFTVETDKPGMQFLKPRTLAHIPDAELAPFMQRDGLSILNSYFKQAARRAEWAKYAGDRGEKLNALLDKAVKQGATKEDMEAAQKFIRAVDGTLGDTINPEARRLMGNMIVYQNLRLLPLGIFSSVVDPLGIMVNGATMRDSFSAFKRGIKEIAKNFKGDTDAAKDAATQFAEDVGTIDNTMLTRTLGANYSQGMVGERGRRLNDTLFRFNLMEQYNQSMRVAATEAAMGFLKRHASGTASPHSLRWLNELGLQPGDVQLDASGRVKVFEHEGLSAEHALKMKAALNRWVDGAVLRPDAADVPIWMNDPHFALFAHLKRFTYSFHETILKRVAHEYQNGNYAPAMVLASYVPTMVAADLVKGLIQGGGQQPSWKQDWDLADYIQSGIERAGLYGVGQFGVDALGNIQHGGSGIGALTGPTVDQLTEAIKALGGREQFGEFAVHSMPANALYGGLIGHAKPDAKFVD